MINFRFHLVSLVAVFLALGVGILVGSTVVDQVIVDRLDREIRDVRRESNEIRGRNDVLSADVSRLEDFLRKSAPYTVATRLAGVSVAIVAEKGVDGGTVKETLDLLRQAGADVPGVLWLEDAWRLDDGTQLQKLRAAARVSGNAAAARLGAMRRLALRLSTAPTVANARSTSTDVLTRLSDAGFVRHTDGSDADFAAFPSGATRVLVITGTESRLSGTETLVDLVTSLSRANVATVVGEVYDDHNGAQPVPERGASVTPVRGDGALSKLVSTIDDMDLAQGEIGAVIALDQIGDAIVGQYGYGTGASAPLPEPSP